MNIRSLLRLTGVIGFVAAVITNYIFMAYIIMPATIPILTHQLETQLSSEGISVDQSTISSIVSLTTTFMLIGVIVGPFIGWLIESAVLWALLRAFKVSASFTDTWLLSGNYQYLAIIQTAIIAATPLLSYMVNSIVGAAVAHKSIMSDPVILTIGLAFVILGSLLLAYIFARVYGTSMKRTLVPTLIALIIFWLISTVA